MSFVDVMLSRLLRWDTQEASAFRLDAQKASWRSSAKKATVDEGIDQIVAVFDRPQGTARHCSRTEPCEGAHANPSGKIERKERIGRQEAASGLSCQLGMFDDLTEYGTYLTERRTYLTE
jgi:hypothetical protein